MKLIPGTVRQLAFPLLDPLETAKHFSNLGADERGAVFTRRAVVNFILDLVGYTTQQSLHKFRVLEPAFGEGDFLVPVAERLLTAYNSSRLDRSKIVEDLSGAIRAVEVHRGSIENTQRKLTALLQNNGIAGSDARQILEKWIIEGDFLLVDLPHRFTHAIGNPPYVRQELIPDMLLAEYRRLYKTIYDRADLYIPFIERCLTNLEFGGTLGFICADRWMKNKYGGPLRAMIAEQYHLASYIDMVDTPAFDSEVSAYPAIIIIKREEPGPTRIAHRPQIDQDKLTKLARDIRIDKLPQDSSVVELTDIVKGHEPWVLQSFAQLKIVRRIERDFPTLEETGCKVGIGVATGADRVFIGPFENLDIEPDRKLPLVKTKDIQSGTVQWQGLGVINPFQDNGNLVDLKDYPKLTRYLSKHANVIRNRNCAKKNPKAWYRTIDRIYPELTYQPKLLIPDIKCTAHVVYEDSQFYPHHNLYFVTSEQWDLKALQVVLQSDITKLFVSTYSTEMRGGYFRFQAQYLRRIRLPYWDDIPESIRQNLLNVAQNEEIETRNQIVFELYRLTPEERAILSDNCK